VAILQLFGIKVLVYPDRVEIKGTIPPQVLRQGEEPDPETGLVLPSPSPSQGEGEYVFERGFAPLKLPGYYFKIEY